MKKLFYFAAAAVMGFAIASCKPTEEPEKSTLTITVTDITGTEATVKVTNSASDYFMWNVAIPEDLEGYANPYEYWRDNWMIHEETYNENPDIYNYFMGVNSYSELVKAMYCLENEYVHTFENLQPETQYLVYAFKIDTLGQLASPIIDTLTFTTLEGPSEEELMYKFEPTTAGEYTMQADSIRCDNYGDFFENNTSLFYTILKNANNESLTLDFVAPAGETTIPAGTYSVVAPAEFSALSAGQILAGNYQYYSSYGLGTYMVMDGGSTALWVENGSLNVQVANDVYTITGTLTSHFGSTIQVHYEGPITVTKVEQPDQAPAKRILKQPISIFPFN